jgi:RecA-family ATPase
MTSDVPLGTRWGLPADPELAKRMAEITRMRAMKLQEQLEPEYFPPLDYHEITPTSEFIKNPPPNREYLFKNLLPSGIVAGVIAVGGTGKGYLMNLIGLSLATGLKVGPLEPTRKFKVLYLPAEDDQEELKRRTISTMKGVWLGEPPPEVDNFIPLSVFGKLGPLMQLDMSKNPVNAPAYDWLCKTLEKLSDVEVVILDPKSMFYGLVENDNDHNAAWVKCLASIARRFKITIIFAHHESKARAGSQDQASSRGGGALTDGCRWVANIRTMDPKTAEKFQISDPDNFIELCITKSNYAPKLPEPVYFRRGLGGALRHVDLAAERVQELARKLVELLATEGESFSRNDLIQEQKGKGISDELKKVAQRFNRIKDVNRAVDFAMEAGWLSETYQKGKKGRGKSILQITKMGRM